MSQDVLAAAVAVASAFAFAGATVGQQRAASETADADARGGAFVRRLLTSPRWLAATGGTAVGYVLQATALGLGPVVVVQPILVTSLLFALPLGAYLAHHRLRWTAAVSGSSLAVSLAVFLALANPNRGASHGSLSGWLLATAVIVPVSAACLVIANRRSGPVRAGLLAVTVGLFGGALAVLTKAVVESFGSGLVAVLTDRETYGLVTVGLVGILPPAAGVPGRRSAHVAADHDRARTGDRGGPRDRPAARTTSGQRVRAHRAHRGHAGHGCLDRRAGPRGGPSAGGTLSVPAVAVERRMRAISKR
ncbi:MAG TPA: DMT family transporter [Jatrophihabitans sp.]|jgi:hypothetical protein|nr:DMT family transporter [Jatrophihabitans sp.]